MKNTLLMGFLGLFLAFQLSAQTPLARTWFYNNKGVKTSVKEKWAEDNQGLKHGTYIKYFEDGEREILGYYNHDKPNGQWEITVYSNLLFQQVKSITYVNFLNGQEHGLYKTTMGTTILVQGNYTNGVKTGYWKDDYNIDDKVYSEGSYVNGKRNGEWKNTSVIMKSKEDMGWNILAGDANTEKTETKKGYKTIYQNGEAISSYNDKGINILEQQKQADLNEKIEQEYDKCSSIIDYQNFRKKYPNSEFDSNAIVQINKLKKEEQEEAIAKKKEDDYLNPLIAQWKSLHDTSISFSFFNEYYKEFPNGYRINDVHELLEKDKQKVGAFMDVLNDRYESETNDLLNIPEKIKSEQYQYNGIRLDKTTDNIGVYDELFQRYPKVEFPKLDEWLKQKIVDKRNQYKFQIEYLIQLNNEKSLQLALSMLNVINRYSSSLHNSSALPFNIQRCLLYWKLGHVDIAFKEAQIHKNDVIEYSDGNVKYSKKFKELYRDYKIGYPNEKENWSKISAILGL